MERIQLYPSEELKAKMKTEAEQKKCSLSQLTVDILMQHYGLLEQRRPLPELLPIIMKEIEEYISDKPAGTEFDLLSASDTFRSIHMVAEGKPSTNRASVGRSFAARLGYKPFENIRQALSVDGTVKKSDNKAIMYVIMGKMN